MPIQTAVGAGWLEPVALVRDEATTANTFRQVEVFRRAGTAGPSPSLLEWPEIACRRSCLWSSPSPPRPTTSCPAPPAGGRGMTDSFPAGTSRSSGSMLPRSRAARRGRHECPVLIL